MQAPRSRGNETTQLHEVPHHDGVEPPARRPIREGDTPQASSSNLQAQTQREGDAPQTPSPLPLQTGTQNERGDGGGHGDGGKDSARRPAKGTER